MFIENAGIFKSVIPTLSLINELVLNNRKAF